GASFTASITPMNYAVWELLQCRTNAARNETTSRLSTPSHIAKSFPAKTKGRHMPPLFHKSQLAPCYGVESGRRFNVGRSSSGLALGSCPFLSACSVLVRNVGFPRAACALREHTILHRPAFTVS